MFQNKSTALPLRSRNPIRRNNLVPTDENRQINHARMMYKDNTTTTQATKVFGGIPSHTAVRARINNNGLNSVVGSKIAKPDLSSKINRTMASRIALTNKLSTNTTANANNFGARRAVRNTLISAGSMSSLAAPLAQRKPLVAVKPVAQNKPAAIQDKPTVIQTQPVAIQKKLVAIQKKPVAVQKKPVAIQKKPVVVKQAVKPIPPQPQIQAQAVVTVNQTNIVPERAAGRAGKPVAQQRQSSTSSSSTLVLQEEPKPVMSPVPCRPIEPVFRFVKQDIVEYALSHQGLRNEQPITIDEISEFDADVDNDTGLISDVNDDVFGYMRELDVKLMADPNYMYLQTDMSWATRTVLVEWLVQIHDRFGLHLETLHLAMNYVDRVLSARNIGRSKIQLVGTVCLLLACKYEETRLPSVRDFIFMTEGNYGEQEMLKAERYILRVLNFELGWPGPLSFLRRISMADKFNHRIRAVSKYLIEVTLIDKRFIGIPSSQVAAVAYFVSMRLLDIHHEWSRKHAYYAGYFESELLPLAFTMVQILMKPACHKSIYVKYASRTYLKVSEQIQRWFQYNHPDYLLFTSNTDLREI